MDQLTNLPLEPRTEISEFQLRPISQSILRGPVTGLLDLAFQVPAQARFLDDFPVWERLSDPNTIQRLGAFDPNGNLAATAAGRIAKLRVPTGTIPVGIIGMVATRPVFRGRGLASRLVASTVAWLAKQEVPLIVLWGSEHQFYRRHGFAVCGRQALIPLRALQLPAVPGSREVGRGWRPEIFDALRSRKCGLALGSQDRAWIEAHSNVKWFWIRSKTGISAYLALGRGIDLGGMVHEWGGEPASLRRLLAYVAGQVCPEGQILGSPEAFRSLLTPGDGAPALQALCLARVLDSSRILSAYGVRSELGLIPSRTPEEGARLAEALFGGKLDLPLWFWGLDSA